MSHSRLLLQKQKPSCITIYKLLPLTTPACRSILALTEIISRKHKRHSLMDELDLKKLESRVDELIKAVDRLQQENKTLRSSQTSLITERNTLMEKTEMAKTRVEAMISRLKALEDE